MLSNWLFFVVVAGLSSIVFNFFNRSILTRHPDSTIYAWLFEVIRLVFFLLLIPFDYRFSFTPFSLLVLLALGLSELFGVYLYMKMHAHTELSISSILSLLRVILVPLFAFIFLGERLTTLQYLGTSIIFAGCLVVSVNGEIRHSRGIKYAYGFVLINTLSNVLLKLATIYASTPIVSAAFSLPAAILIPVLMHRTNARLPTLKNIWRPTFIATFFNILTMYAIVSAYQLAPAGQVNSVFQGITVFAVLIGIIFLNERKHLALKLFGAALTSIGILLLV